MPDDNHHSLDGASPSLPDPYGHAALLLVESLIHGLCESGLLSTGEAIDIVERAVDVQGEQAEMADGAGAPMWRSHALLSSIAASLRVDGGTTPEVPRHLP